MDYIINVTPEKLYDAFQKASPEERKPILQLIDKYGVFDEADIKMALYDIIDNWSYHPQDALLRGWVESATTSPKDERPRYVEGKGIYVPVVGKYLAMKNSFGGEEVNWNVAVKAGAPTRDEWYIILYFKAEINRLLRDNGGEEIEGWYWTSTEDTASYSCRVYASNGFVSDNHKLCQNPVRTWVND